MPHSILKTTSQIPSTARSFTRNILRRGRGASSSTFGSTDTAVSTIQSGSPSDPRSPVDRKSISQSAGVEERASVHPVATESTTSQFTYSGTTLVDDASGILHESKSKPKFNKLKAIMKTAFAAIVFVNEGVHASSDVFPPLKSLSGGLKHIVQIQRKIGDDKKECLELLLWIEQQGAVLEDVSSEGVEPDPNLVKAAADFNNVLAKAIDTISAHSSNAFKRYVHLQIRSDERNGICRDIEHALTVFNTQATFSSRIDILAQMAVLQTQLQRSASVMSRSEIVLDDVQVVQF